MGDLTFTSAAQDQIYILIWQTFVHIELKNVLLDYSEMVQLLEHAHVHLTDYLYKNLSDISYLAYILW